MGRERIRVYTVEGRQPLYLLTACDNARGKCLRR